MNAVLLETNNERFKYLVNEEGELTITTLIHFNRGLLGHKWFTSSNIQSATWEKTEDYIITFYTLNSVYKFKIIEKD